MDHTNENGVQELPKEWTFDEPLQYAPPKPDGDPWVLLLGPLLKNDKMQCEAWKDEVHNLLIFAGLFSAVVTAFIVESYKSLQPNPDEAIISLLAHIATHLDRESNFTSDSNIFPTSKKFSPETSSIRINVFWFISLVLSLTTVLVGIISLQWIREHQSYVDLSPRETYAMFNMRAEGMKRWHVDKIFTALPLLLQFALVLFLTGMMDFLHTFQQWAVIIPVAVVVSVTLAFLVATTILPTLQTFSHFFFATPNSGRPTNRRTPPGLCPYKSPQSHAVLKLSRPLFHLWYHVLHSPKARHIWRLILTHPFLNRHEESNRLDDHRSLYIYATAVQSKWIHFDSVWLHFRDMHMRYAFGRPPIYGFVRGGNVTAISSIYDIIMCLKKRYHESTSAAAYYCISTISEAALQKLDEPNSSVLPAESLSQNDFLCDLLNDSEDPLITDFLNLRFYFDESAIGNSVSIKVLTSILHQQNLLAFSRLNGFSAHSKELSLRFFRHYYQGYHRTYPSNTAPTIPRCLALDPFWFFGPGKLDLLDRDISDALSWQVATLTLSMFQQFDQEFHPQSLIYNPFAQKASLAFYMEVAGSIALKALSPVVQNVNHRSPSHITKATATTFHNVFVQIDQRLMEEISSWSADEERPSLLFYLATCLTYQLTKLKNIKALTSLIRTIVKYKQRTIDKGKIDSVVENRLCTDQQNHSWKYSQSDWPNLFSLQWWATFDNSLRPAIPDIAREAETNTVLNVKYYPFEAPTLTAFRNRSLDHLGSLNC